MEIARANRMTPTATIQISRSVGYGFTAFCATRGGGSRRIRDWRAATCSSTVFLPAFCLYTRALLRARRYESVSNQAATTSGLIKLSQQLFPNPSDLIDTCRLSWGAHVIPSVHFLIRQAARERLAGTRSLNEEAKARHFAMAELYTMRAQQLQSG